MRIRILYVGHKSIYAASSKHNINIKLYAGIIWCTYVLQKLNSTLVVFADFSSRLSARNRTPLFEYNCAGNAYYYWVQSIIELGRHQVHYDENRDLCMAYRCRRIQRFSFSSVLRTIDYIEFKMYGPQVPMYTIYSMINDCTTRRFHNGSSFG